MMQVKRNSPYAWLLAMRPKTLTAALIPVGTSTALAGVHHGVVWRQAGLCMLFAALMQVAANFINDLYDCLKGADGADRLGPERACAQGWVSVKAMRRAIAFVLLCAGGVGVCLLEGARALGCHWPWLLGVGLACGIFAFLYTLLLSYVGGGDLLVWVFFGVVPVLGTYYVQTGSLVPELGWLAASCGLLIDTLLVVNNYRDRETDARCGKHTLVVCFGERFGRYCYLFQGVAAYVCAAMLALWGHMWVAVMAMFYLLPHYLTWRKMVEIGEGRGLNRVLGFTSRNMLLMGFLIAAGLWAG